MNYKIIQFDFPFQTAGKNREFCIEYNDLYIKHINTKIDGQKIEAFHDTKKVIGGIDKHVQMYGNANMIYNNDVIDKSTSFDIHEEDPSFLLYDEAGLNYMHFFFCCFGKSMYYDELIKTKNIKLYIPEELIDNKDNCSYVKEWFDLYYPNIKINTLLYNKRYKFKNVIVPNSFYNYPQPYGYTGIVDMIRKVVDRVDTDPNLLNKTAYISRQDTLKRGWWHKRTLQNELELINKFQKLNYDIIELMDYNMKDKIRIFKSYKNIIQQHGASTTGILFSSKNTNHFLLEHPKMTWWATPKCREFAQLTKSNLIVIEGFGELLPEEKQKDDNNYPWKLIELDYLVDNIASLT
jgi:hypothetical protein